MGASRTAKLRRLLLPQGWVGGWLFMGWAFLPRPEQWGKLGKEKGWGWKGHHLASYTLPC